MQGVVATRGVVVGVVVGVVLGVVVTRGVVVGVGAHVATRRFGLEWPFAPCR